MEDYTKRAEGFNKELGEALAKISKKWGITIQAQIGLVDIGQKDDEGKEKSGEKEETSRVSSDANAAASSESVCGESSERKS